MIAIKQKEKINLAELSRETDTTYSHLCKMVKKLESKGYLQSERVKQSKNLNLTEKGREMAELLEKATQLKFDKLKD